MSDRTRDAQYVALLPIVRRRWRLLTHSSGSVGGNQHTEHQHQRECDCRTNLQEGANLLRSGHADGKQSVLLYLHFRQELPDLVHQLQTAVGIDDGERSIGSPSILLVDCGTQLARFVGYNRP
jgi:hypothetical protein